MLQLYDPKVRVFDAWGVWQYNGAESWRIAIEGWFSTNPGDKFKVEFTDSIAIGGPELATMTAIVTYAGIAPDGSESNSMQNRSTWVVKTSGHNLRIIHEHTSAPIGFEDLKAILKRQA